MPAQKSTHCLQRQAGHLPLDLGLLTSLPTRMCAFLFTNMKPLTLHPSGLPLQALKPPTQPLTAPCPHLADLSRLPRPSSGGTSLAKPSQITTDRIRTHPRCSGPSSSAYEVSTLLSYRPPPAAAREQLKATLGVDP